MEKGGGSEEHMEASSMARPRDLGREELSSEARLGLGASKRRTGAGDTGTIPGNPAQGILVATFGHHSFLCFLPSGL